DLDEPGAFEDGSGELGGVAVDPPLAVLDGRARTRRREGAVDAPATVLGPGAPSPDAGEVRALHRLEPSNAHELTTELRDPHLQVAAGAHPVHQPGVVRVGLRRVVAEDLALQVHHAPDVLLV